jgi:hypothetical protein
MIRCVVMILLASVAACQGRAGSNRAEGKSSPIELASPTCREKNDKEAKWSKELLLQGRALDSGEKITLSRTVRPLKGGGSAFETTVSLDGAQLIRRSVTLGSASPKLVDEFDPTKGEGPHRVEIAISGDGTAIATIDGKSTSPFRPEDGKATVTYEDGTPAKLGPRMETRVEAILGAALKALDEHSRSCFQDMDKRSEPPSDVQGSAFALTSDNSDKGHFSYPDSTAACAACQGACGGAYLACTAGCSTGTPFGVLCFAACLGAGTQCQKLCSTSGSKPCCPVDCGASCCHSSETCLNGPGALCCSSGKEACGGALCCPQGTACVTGFPGPTCCNASNVCGNACCGDGESCLDPSLSKCGCSPACTSDSCGQGSHCRSDGCCIACTETCSTSDDCTNGKVCSSNGCCLTP